MSSRKSKVGQGSGFAGRLGACMSLWKRLVGEADIRGILGEVVA